MQIFCYKMDDAVSGLNFCQNKPHDNNFKTGQNTRSLYFLGVCFFPEV